jgi:purine-nucleoside phosphorylase
LLVTNAAGGINRSLTLGEIVIISDHINLMGNNPLIGNADFVDMTTAYNEDLKKLAYKTAKMQGMKIREGVYLAMSGPSYETPAEINMARTLGADMIGMSTVPEVIVANGENMKVLGLSMVTNMAAGITGEPLSHEEVIETTQMAQTKFKKFINKIVENLKDNETK